MPNGTGNDEKVTVSNVCYFCPITEVWSWVAGVWKCPLWVCRVLGAWPLRQGHGADGPKAPRSVTHDPNAWMDPGRAVCWRGKELQDQLGCRTHISSLVHEVHLLMLLLPCTKKRGVGRLPNPLKNGWLKNSANPLPKRWHQNWTKLSKQLHKDWKMTESIQQIESIYSREYSEPWQGWGCLWHVSPG